MTTNAINYQNLQELKRHNLAMEGLDSSKVDVSRQQVELGKSQVALGYANLGETTRSNIAKEQELARHNLQEEGLQAVANQNQLIGSGLNALSSLVSSVVRLY